MKRTGNTSQESTTKEEYTENRKYKVHHISHLGDPNIMVLISYTIGTSLRERKQSHFAKFRDIGL